MNSKSIMELKVKTNFNKKNRDIKSLSIKDSNVKFKIALEI